METECEASDHDNEDNGHGKEGDDHILKENDVFSNTGAICHQCWGQIQHLIHNQDFEIYQKTTPRKPFKNKVDGSGTQMAKEIFFLAEVGS